MKRALAQRAVVSVVLAVAVGACGRGEPSKAERDAAKRAEDAALLALPYPARSGAQPASIRSVYDTATDRTSMTLTLAGLTPSPPIPGVGPVTLCLTSSFDGPVRATDNPEGSVDGSISAVCASPGALAIAGVPGGVVIDGVERPFKPASAKNAYSSSPAAGGVEEVARFRFPTPDLVAAANAGGVAISVGRVRFEVSGPALADLHEFAARLNPRP
jgi:hypothetical protein